MSAPKQMQMLSKLESLLYQQLEIVQSMKDQVPSVDTEALSKF